MAFTMKKVSHKIDNSTHAPTIDTSKKIKCIVNSFVYMDEESGFFVFSAILPDNQPEMREVIKGKIYQGRKITVVGTSLLLTKTVSEGQEVEVWGNYGPGKREDTIQFEAVAIQEIVPETSKQIEVFLSSGKIYGIGPKTAKKIVNKFQTETINILDNSPELLLDIDGVNAKKLELIKQSWKEWRQIYEIVATMRMYGIGDSAAVKVYEHFQGKALEIITKDPYRLTEVPTIGFKTADKIAMTIGMQSNDPQRIEKCILYCLEVAAEKGHTAYPKEDVAYDANDILRLEPSLINNAIENLITKNTIIPKTLKIKAKRQANKEDYIIEKAGVAHIKFHAVEEKIASELKRIVQFPTLESPEEIEHKINYFMDENPDKLVPSQLEAAKNILSSKVAVLTGGPGTGKTHTIKSLLNYFDSVGVDATLLTGDEETENPNAKTLKSVLCAPTGRAAKRMEESTKKKGSTIHRLLVYKDGAFLFNEQNKLKGDVFIVDECSMIDVWLMAAFLKAVPSSARIIFVGDVDQLPSVGEGNVLKDIIDSKAIQVARLTEIQRQAKDSNIIVAAHSIIHNQMPPLLGLDSDSDFVFVERNGNEDIHSSMLEIVAKLVSNGINESEIQILSPKKESEVGTHALNTSMRGILNSHFIHHQELQTKFVPGDRVMQIKNDKELDIYNGDMGIVMGVDEENASMDIVFDDKVIEFSGQTLNHLNLSYAITIHKSQGSDYPYVVIPMSKSHSFMWDTNLLYTAVTRAKHKVILVGEKQALAFAVSNLKQNDRITGLKDLIIEEFSKENKMRNRI